ncbi:hypothetical protein [Arcanobacterium phocae]|uniref:hypothetical protein n=1 Tax=Arcanobacterium phocae TaxID=131112 RepID=UPI001C0E907A|nr:hypothetical protein [Arcanobacterium phocae]
MADNPEKLALRAPADIRAFYYAVTEDGDDKADVPDGKLFCDQLVQVMTISQKVIHTGFR